MSYILSVIIPTRDRYEYLFECLKTLVKLSSDDMEIIVQDNSENNTKALEFIKKLDYRHIKYFYESTPLTVTQNSELAVEHSTGEYVCFIGDDDSITSSLIQVVKLLKKYSIEAINCEMVKYYWTDVTFKYLKKNTLSFDKRRLTIKTLDTSKVLRKYLKNGMQEIKYLPRLYHAVMSRESLNKMKKTAGCYFPGPSPDMANATAAATIIKSHIYIKMPLIVSGSSYKSAAGMGQRGKHKGKLSGLKHLSPNIEEEWDSRIPKLWLGHTIWPESCIKALHSMNNYDLERFMNWNAMHARTLLRNPDCLEDIKPFLKNKFDYIKILFECIKALIPWSISKIFLYIRIIFKQEYASSEPISLLEACNIVNEYNENNQDLAQLEKFFKKG